MPDQAGEAYVDLVPRLSPGFAEKTAAMVETSVGGVLDRVSARLTSVGDRLAGIGTRMATFVTLPIAAAGVAAFNLASDLNESISKVNVVFEDSASAILAWSEGAATGFGMSKQQALEAAGTFGNLFRAMEIGQAPARDMSMSLVGLAGDLASFNNADPTEVLEALRAGLLGEAEPLRRFGVSLSAARIEAKALEMGLAANKDELTAGAKAQAAYAIILEDTKLAQGDYARTADGAANSQRTFTAQLKDAGAQIGQVLLPIGMRLLSWGKELLAMFQGLSPGWQKIILGAIGVAAALGPIMAIGGNVLKLFGFIAAHPILLVLAAIAVAAWLVYDNWSVVWPEVQRIAEEVFTWLEENAGFVIDAVRGIIDGATYVVENWSAIWAEIQAVAQAVWDWLSTNLGPLFETIGTAIEVALQRVDDVVTVVIAALVFAWDNFGVHVITAVTTAFNLVVGVIEGFIGVIRGILNVFIGIFTLDWNTFWSGITGIVSGVWTTIQAIISGAISAVFNIISFVLTAIQVAMSAAWDAIKGAVSAAWEGIKSAVQTGIDTVANAVSGLAGRLLEFVGGLLEAGAALGRAIVDGIGDGVDAAAEFAGDIASGILSAFKKGWNGVARTINNFIPNDVGFDTPFGFIGVDLPDNPIPTFHSGGIVPGRPGSDVLAMVQAGERIVSRREVDNERDGATIINVREVNVDFDGDDPSVLFERVRAMVTR